VLCTDRQFRIAVSAPIVHMCLFRSQCLLLCVVCGMKRAHNDAVSAVPLHVPKATWWPAMGFATGDLQ
jgi:hypothetical protein